jgi:hypothetical protein
MTKQIRQTTATKPNSLSTHMRRGKTQRKRGMITRITRSTRATGEVVNARPSLSKRERGRGAGRAAAGRAAAGAGINKSAFVRSLPGALSAAEVIEKGKAKGIKLSAAQVYTIRANARRKGPETESPRTPRAGGREAGRTGRGRTSEGKEAEFVEAALDLGLARAEALIRALRAKASAGWS